MAEATIRAYFETRFAVLEPVFPLACHRLCEGPDLSLEFSYKPPQHLPGEGRTLHDEVKKHQSHKESINSEAGNKYSVSFVRIWHPSLHLSC